MYEKVTCVLQVQSKLGAQILLVNLTSTKWSVASKREHVRMKKSLTSQFR